ncbi:hypothetical protein R9C00_15940 [Flammeovirgaceae bacterium SG7u.111]|nr:hypothetical protein [Flammeovirgaceae bacterium SG7u.132]WPO33194.1 hypothetical protein R9C00_15940 [Flammeovirgaceae bacterium SG7u.111]
MSDPKKDEKRNKTIAVVATVLFNGILAALLIMAIAWRPPDPPIPQFGIEVNFGMDDSGSGDMQSRAPANENKSLDEARQEEPTPKPVQPVQTAPPEQAETEEVVDQVVAAAEESEESVEAVPEEKVKPKVEEKVTPTPKDDPVKQVEPEEKKKEEKPQVNNDALLGGGTSAENKGNSNGNSESIGDMGDEQGNVNAEALIGSNTGKGGSSLDMPGWSWDEPPSADDQSNITGKIIFEVKIDDAGEVISVERKFSTIADRTVIASYKQAVYDLTFSQMSASASAPRVTTGSITFIITSK